jgi:hypothetical protein
MNAKPFLLLFALAFAAPDSARAQQWTREHVQQWAPQAQHWTEAQWQRQWNRLHPFAAPRSYSVIVAKILSTGTTIAMPALIAALGSSKK